MPAYLLDSSVIIDVLNGKRDRPALLRNLLEEGHLLACCPIQIAEIYTGLRANEERATADFLKSLEFYAITWAIARHAGLLKRDFAREGKILTLADTMIAAVALAHDLTLITDNVKDFPMDGLRLYAFPEL